LKILAEHITQQLKERAFCVVFEGDLQRCWPSSGMSQAERERKSKTSPNLRGGVPQFSRLGSLREQYFKRPEPGIGAASI
jgi:hypothetical protein